MKITRSLAALRAARDELVPAGQRLALVATMGALHDGHVALVRAARAAGYVVVASIFVNPTQFGPSEDFARYPRDEAADCAVLQAAGCAIAWLPDGAVMYPACDATTIEVAGPALLWEGAARPGHFRGVATVVARLFGQVRPDASFFGEKDWQQVQVVRRMVEDLLLPVQIVEVPTWREADGLAMSSRNRYLAPRSRDAAPLLFAALNAARGRINEGWPVAAALAEGRAALERAGFALDYLALVDSRTMAPIEAPAGGAPIEAPAGGARLIAAARLDGTRLLDTIALGA